MVSDGQGGGGPVGESLVGGQWVTGEPVDGLVVGGMSMVSGFLILPVLKQASSLIDRILSHEFSIPKHNFD